MKHPHVLLISLETLRRDHLGCYGYSREVMPHLDRIAERGVRFADSVANCGWTLPQHMTLLTGLYPLTHNCVLLRGNPPLDAGWTTLAEHFKAAGYRTFAGVNSRNGYGGGAHFGFDRGFDEHNPGAEYNRHMPWTEDFIVSRFRDNHESGPCFVYVHVNDSHEPWDPPEPWSGMWGRSYHDQYMGELSYVDHYLGRTFAALKEMGIFDDMLTVVFADHGTEFAEHEWYEKKVNVYNEILHVPLLFHSPARLPEGRVARALVESADVAPTICELAGVEPLDQFQGRSLAPRISGASDEAPEYVCSHTRHDHQGDGGPAQFDHYAIQTPRHKFIRLELHAQPDALHQDWKQRMQTIMIRAWRDPGELEAGTVIGELYDLERDPGEHRCLIRRAGDEDTGAKASPHKALASKYPEAGSIADALEAKLDKWIELTMGAARS